MQTGLSRTVTDGSTQRWGVRKVRRRSPELQCQTHHRMSSSQTVYRADKRKKGSYWSKLRHREQGLFQKELSLQHSSETRLRMLIQQPVLHCNHSVQFVQQASIF
jgi:hypothetical protein